eukprot:131752-Chlamydomonas_euryale.AAC.1
MHAWGSAWEGRRAEKAGRREDCVEMCACVGQRQEGREGRRGGGEAGWRVVLGQATLSQWSTEPESRKVTWTARGPGQHGTHGPVQNRML